MCMVYVCLFVVLFLDVTLSVALSFINCKYALQILFVCCVSIIVWYVCMNIVLGASYLKSCKRTESIWSMYADMFVYMHES